MPGCNHCPADEAAKSTAVDPGFRKVLWIALIANAAMFFLEVGASWTAGSVSLLADSLDFGGDAANYALSLFVLGMAIQTRAKAALLKGISMGLYGVGVLGFALEVRQLKQSLQELEKKLIDIRANNAAIASRLATNPDEPEGEFLIADYILPASNKPEK